MTLQNTALLLIGFQNDFFAPDGILHSVVSESSKVTKTVQNTVQLLRSLVETPMEVVAAPLFFTPTYEELVDPVGVLKIIKDSKAFQRGAKGSEMIEEFRPFRNQILEVPGRRGFNAFTNTNLNEILQQKQITHLVLAGAVTSICIDSTGRAAHDRGYQVSVLSDCTSARTSFEQEFYFNHVFPLYAETIPSSRLV
jgi:nicotinamidase-related amidase